MTGFSKEQEAYIEKLAWAIGDKIISSLKSAQADAIELHTARCKTAKAVNRMYWMAVGFGMAGLAGGGWVGYLVAAAKIASTVH